LIISKTPLRISLFGGGTDFPEYFTENRGQVLSTTIDKYTKVVLNKRPFDNKIRLGYSKTELVNNADDLEHELAREAINLFNLKGIEITTISDIPGGTGLSTSSSILVGMLSTLATYANTDYNKSDLVRWAIEIEKHKLDKPIGYQDQVSVCYGGFRNIQFDSFPRDTYHSFYPIRVSDKTLSRLERTLYMFYVGGQRESSDILNEQEKNVDKNYSILKEMYSVCEEAVDELQKDRPESIGELLNATWTLKKKLASKISNEKVDFIYNKGLKLGATGGKLLGAGGNGFLLFQHLGNSEEFIYRMNEIGVRHMPFKFETQGTRIIFNDL